MNESSNVRGGAMRVAAALLAWLQDHLRGSPIALIAIIALLATVALNPAKAGLLVWGISKVSTGAYLGYWADRWLFRAEDRPHLQQGIARGTAWKRRALIAAAAIFAFGMLP